MFLDITLHVDRPHDIRIPAHIGEIPAMKRRSTVPFATRLLTGAESERCAIRDTARAHACDRLAPQRLRMFKLIATMKRIARNDVPPAFVEWVER